jgi:hypothetical protein
LLIGFRNPITDGKALLVRLENPQDVTRVSQLNSASLSQSGMGHKRIEMTLNIYAHALPSMQQEAAAKLGKLLHG